MPRPIPMEPKHVLPRNSSATCQRRLAAPARGMPAGAPCSSPGPPAMMLSLYKPLFIPYEVFAQNKNPNDLTGSLFVIIIYTTCAAHVSAATARRCAHGCRLSLPGTAGLSDCTSAIPCPRRGSGHRPVPLGYQPISPPRSARGVALPAACTDGVTACTIVAPARGMPAGAPCRFT